MLESTGSDFETEAASLVDNTPEIFSNLHNIYPMIKSKATKTRTRLFGGKCKTHNRPLELVCLKDRTRVCTDCALFGKHKGHKLLKFEEAIKEESTVIEKLTSSALGLQGELHDMGDGKDALQGIEVMLLQQCQKRKTIVDRKIHESIEKYAIWLIL